MKLSQITLLLLTSILLACGGKNDCSNNENCKEDCPRNLLCTEQFVTIGLNITLDGAPIQLDEYKSIINGTEEEFTWEDEFPGFEGYHIVLTDAQMDLVEMDGTQVTIQGTFSTDEAIYTVDELYVIGHDCCHIVKLQGLENLELNP